MRRPPPPPLPVLPLPPLASVGHASCTNDECQCDWRYLPPACEAPLYANHMAAWYAFIVGVLVVHGSLVFVTLLGVWAKFRIHRRSVLAQRAAETSVAPHGEAKSAGAGPSFAVSFVNKCVSKRR